MPTLPVSFSPIVDSVTLRFGHQLWFDGLVRAARCMVNPDINTHTFPLRAVQIPRGGLAVEGSLVTLSLGDGEFVDRAQAIEILRELGKQPCGILELFQFVMNPPQLSANRRVLALDAVSSVPIAGVSRVPFFEIDQNNRFIALSSATARWTNRYSFLAVPLGCWD